jgi:predicted anti-sigma-YlaC factor YlaD
MEQMPMGQMPTKEIATKGIKDRCAAMDGALADLLIDPNAAPARVRAHVAECGHCRGELAEIEATMAMLDSWKAAEPNPYFLTRLDARIEEERQAAPAGWRWMARLRDRIAYGSAMPARPLAAMALTLMLLVGGGTYLGITDWNQAPAPTTAVVHDLQTMDNNAQLLDQLEALSSKNDNGD